jgi:uncharacterized repeat protein (TIGR01451 family)
VDRTVADVAVTMSVDEPAPQPDDTIVYTVTATNHGPAAASGLVVTDPLPSGVAYGWDLPSQGAYVSGTGEWAVGTLPSGGSATLEITVTVEAGAAGTTVTNAAWRTATDQTDTNSANDADSAQVEVQHPVSADQAGGLPAAFALSAARPNPFRGGTEVRLDLPEAGRVRLVVFDVAGRRVRTLVDAELPAGRHAAAWDGRDELERRVQAGVYFLRVDAGPFAATRRAVRLE